MARAGKPQTARRSSASRVGEALAGSVSGEPPHSLEAEVSVLGSMILNNETIDVVVPLLKTESFFSPAHQKIYEAALTLHDQQRAVDLVTLRDELDRRDHLDAVGGVEYLAGLVEAVPAAANVEHYAEIAREKAIVRELLQTARQIQESAGRGDQKSRELLDEAQAMILRIAEEGTRGAVAPISEVLKTTFERIDQSRGREGMLTGLSTGFADLDELTSGLQPGELIIVAARPSMGKTTLSLNILEHIGVDLGMPGIIFSLEMSREQLARNMLCARARIDSHRLRRGRLSASEMPRLSQHVGDLSDAPIFIDDTPGLNAFELRAKVRRLKASRGCRIAIIDYLQLLHGPRAESRQIEISHISRSLKGLAREMNIPIIAVAQLNRQVETRDDKRPRMADLRESGSLEQDADVVMLLHRPAYYQSDSTEDDGRAELIIAKQRNGPTGKVNLTFLRQFMRFESSTEGMPEF